MKTVSDMDHIYVIQHKWCSHSADLSKAKQIVNEDGRCPYCEALPTTAEPKVGREWKYGWTKYECGTECVVGRLYGGSLYILAETDRTPTCQSITREDII